MVVPAFTALFSDASGEVPRDLSPPNQVRIRILTSGRVGRRGRRWQCQRQDYPVLGGAPRTLDQLRIEHFLPAMQALHVGAAEGETSRDFFPVACLVLFDSGDEFAILGARPVTLARPVLILGHSRLVDAWVGSLVLDDRGPGLTVKLVSVEGGRWRDGRRNHFGQRCLVTCLHFSSRRHHFRCRRLLQ